MSRKTTEPPEVAPATPPRVPLPMSGGAYIVVDGQLQRDPAEEIVTQPETAGEA